MADWKLLYNQSLKKEFVLLKAWYKKEMQKARVVDKSYAHNMIWEETRAKLREIENSDDPFKTPLRSLTNNIDDQLRRDKKLKYNTVFERETESLIQEDKKIVLNKISLIDAYAKFFRFMKEDGKKYDEKNPFSNPKTTKEKSSINWTNGNNKTDFVKIIYALHEAELINKGEGEITKIVESLGQTFNVGLGKGWQANLSENKNSRNNDYNPLEIFDRIKKAYADYLKEGEK